MVRALGRLAGLVVMAGVAVGAVFVIGMRSKWPPVIDAVRRFNRSVTNPRVLATAGGPGASAAVIRHVGRSSGRRYETPVGAMPVGDTFAIALPYGTRVDWLENVLAAGSATIVHEGVAYLVDRPEVVATDALADELPPDEVRVLRLFRVGQCLQVQQVRRIDLTAEDPAARVDEDRRPATQEAAG